MNIITILLAGLIAGWLTGQIMKGSGYGVVYDIVLGIVGGFIGSWIFGALGFRGNGFINLIIMSAVGAIILVAVIRLINGRHPTN